MLAVVVNNRLSFDRVDSSLVIDPAEDLTT